MKQQKLVFVTAEILELFELLDWWQPQRLSEETKLKPDRIKYLLKMRKEFNSLGNGSNKLTQKQIDIAESFSHALSMVESNALKKLLPQKTGGNKFDFVDLFAGIGGIRKPFDEIGGRCVLTCEWDEYAQKTYKSNWKSDKEHKFVSDIKSITQPAGLIATKQAAFIEKAMPDHDVLLAGFPCQPFSIAGVSKKNALNRAHGFDCKDQGQLFFDICRILSVKQPPIAVLENVKNLKSHNKGTTFQVIKEMLTHLPDHQATLFGKKVNLDAQPYWIANLDDEKPDPKIIDAKNFVPQHRERIVLVCIRRDIVEKLGLDSKIDMRKIKTPEKPMTLKDILDTNKSTDDKYTLSPKLWKYLEDYAKKHKAKGNGFGYGMVYRDDKKSVARTLSARYYKDGSEILVNQDDVGKRPRRMTPQECARLMGFATKDDSFKVPVSDTRGYKQFGNSVVVPVFRAVAQLLDNHIDNIKKFN
jgi:DNA (cytosine-5)-methyltransferase 1